MAYNKLGWRLGVTLTDLAKLRHNSLCQVRSYECPPDQVCAEWFW